MKIGAYPFAVSGSLPDNLNIIRRAILQAAQENIELLAFPECALTGYPPRNLPSAGCVDLNALSAALDELQCLSDRCGMCIICGCITHEGGKYRNSAAVFRPGRERTFYHKRALWGWDRENFVPGSDGGIIEFRGLKIGIRICFEIRFPEFFRELYLEDTNLNIVLFHDVLDAPDSDRYELIRAHIRTRAAENVCPLLAVNATHPQQTAPSMLCGKSGEILAELPPGEQTLLVYDLKHEALSFSEQGRKYICDQIMN